MLMRRFADKTENAVDPKATIVIDVEERAAERGKVRRKHSQFDTIHSQAQRPRKRASIARKLYLAWSQALAFLFHPLIESRVGRWWRSLGEEEEDEVGV